jgi:hypothetical protein
MIPAKRSELWQIQQSFPVLLDGTAANIEGALDLFKKTEFLRFLKDDFENLSVKPHLQAMLEKEKRLQQQHDDVLDAMVAEKEEMRHRIRHMSLFDGIESESVQVTAAKAALSEQASQVDVEKIKAREKANQAEAEKAILSKRLSVLSARVIALDSQLAAQQSSVDQLALTSSDSRPRGRLSRLLSK